MKLNWNFLGGGGCNTKNLPLGKGGGGVWIFSGTAQFPTENFSSMERTLGVFCKLSTLGNLKY